MRGPEMVRTGVRKPSGTTAAALWNRVRKLSPLPSLGCQVSIRCGSSTPGPLAFFVCVVARFGSHPSTGGRLPTAIQKIQRARATPRHPCGHPVCGPHSASAEASCPLLDVFSAVLFGHLATVCSSGETDGCVHGAPSGALCFCSPLAYGRNEKNRAAVLGDVHQARVCARSTGVSTPSQRIAPSRSALRCGGCHHLADHRRGISRGVTRTFISFSQSCLWTNTKHSNGPCIPHGFFRRWMSTAGRTSWTLYCGSCATSSIRTTPSRSTDGKETSEAAILTPPQRRSAFVGHLSRTPHLRRSRKLCSQATTQAARPSGSSRGLGWIRAIWHIFFPSVFMTKTLTKKKEVVGRKPAETETNDSSVPIWKTQHNRVQGAMWQYLQDDGTARFTVSISRSYKDQDDGSWHNVHYFDRKDLQDVRAICSEAEVHILGAEGMTQEVEED